MLRNARIARILLAALFPVLGSAALFAQAPAPAARRPLTVAEASDYKATATCAEVEAFIRELRTLSPLMRVESIGTSTEGRDIPLLVIGDPLPASPAAVGKDRIVIYIQANIHAGEVEGKEASLMLAREILLDPRKPYLDKVVLLIAPLFNPDGNDHMDPANRRGQVGPEKGSGVRYNGQNLDLNRDAMKLESPEMLGLVRNVLLRWDPLLSLDLHTTNGSYHEEPVTYSWPLCPNADPEVLRYAREVMMPAIDRTMEEAYGTLSVPYGDPVDSRDMEKGWRTFSHQPRYMTNYIGLRNRLSILDENYSYADYKTRVLGCYALLKATLDYASGRAAEIAALCAEADRRTVERGRAPGAGATFGLDFAPQALPGTISIRGYEMEPVEGGGAGGGFARMRPTDRKKTYIVPYLADFVPARTVRVPAAYLIPLADPAAADKLRDHGIALERLTAPASLEVEAFRMSEIKGAERLFQGHRTNQVKGEYVTETREFPAGTLVVRTAQPLGHLAAYLLEPESDDGLIVWNFLDRHLAAQWGRGIMACPIYKLYVATDLKTAPTK